MKKIKLPYAFIIFGSYRAFLFLIFIFSIHFSFSQTIPLIHLKKEGPFVFFQKGQKSDTLIRFKTDEFYLFVPDSLKPNISILTENGQLQANGQDSLYKFVYLKGLKYESLFLKNEMQTSFEFKVLINGVSDFDPKKIRIQFFSKKENRMILENSFFYKPY